MSMRVRQVGVMAALVVGFLFLVAVPVMGFGGGPAQVDDSETNASAGTFGQQVSTFMQTSAVDANTTVDSGLWQVSVNDSDDPAKDVTSRTVRLERKLHRLQNRTEHLRADRASLPEAAYTARATALREQIANLREQINETTATAERVGVNTSSLARLKATAGNATGPEVAAVARAISDAPRGPPADRPGNGPPGESNRGNGGPPADRGRGTSDGGNVPDSSGSGGPASGNATDGSGGATGAQGGSSGQAGSGQGGSGSSGQDGTAGSDRSGSSTGGSR